MSDYLSNLVDRSLDRADVIQPRLPSLFEPAQGIGSPIAGLWQQEQPTTTEVIEQSVPEVRNPRSVARQSSPISRIFDRVMERRSAESLINPNLPSLSSQTTEIEVSQPLFRPQPESAQPESVDRAEPTPASSSEIQPLSLQPQMTERQIAAGDVSVEQPKIASQPQFDRDRPIDRIITTPNRSPSLNPASISVRDRPDRIELSPLPTDLTPSQNPPLLGQMTEHPTMEQIRSVIPAIQPEVVSNPIPAPVPTIQVTIGRIEVRATTAPATPAATTARSQPPVMSLDEYLHQRGGGR